MDIEYGIDTSWENEYIRETEGTVTYSPEPMTQIHAHLLYIDSHNVVQYSVNKTLPLDVLSDELGSQLSESALMHLIHSNREFQRKRYKCDGISQYCLSAEPTALFNRVRDPDYSIESPPYFQSFDIPRAMHFPPSLFIFHSINRIWILFRELILVNDPPKLVSIIKKEGSDKPKKTKRVRISHDLPTVSKTRKRI